jgi:hypothetical protein
MRILIHSGFTLLIEHRTQLCNVPLSQTCLKIAHHVIAAIDSLIVVPVLCKSENAIYLAYSIEGVHCCVRYENATVSRLVDILLYHCFGRLGPTKLQYR